MDKFIVNIIHRPELMPEYINTDAQAGKADELGGQEVVGESLDIFRLQQDIAHANGLKCTIQMTYASLYNDEAIKLAKDYHEKNGDEMEILSLYRVYKQQYPDMLKRWTVEAILAKDEEVDASSTPLKTRPS